MANKEIVFLPETRASIFDQCADMMEATDPWITLGMDKERCLKAFEGECKEIFSVWKNGKLAGFVILQMCGTFRGYIQTLLVAEEYRGQGIANHILEFCEEHIHKISPNVFMCVSSFNTHARRVYERYGFKEIGVLKDFIKPGFDEILLWKRK
jgi:ribosomal protein S18 acetylase RimI-like enzyme